MYDVLVGVNLLREGLDLPEVSLVAILDADKEGFLRSDKSLIQVSLTNLLAVVQRLYVCALYFWTQPSVSRSYLFLISHSPTYGCGMQTIGRASRHVNGTVILYCQTATASMKVSAGCQCLLQTVWPQTQK